MSDSTEDDFPPGWSGTMRRDRLFVGVTDELTWVVFPHDGRPAVATCPCCRKPFATKRAAMLVADAIYPPGKPADPE